jgi:hypothetical protein
MALKNAPITDVLKALCTVGRAKMLNFYGLDSCAPAAAIAVEVLTSYGYVASPMRVDLQIHNAALVAFRKAGSEGEAPADAHAIAVGDADATVGHVVVITCDNTEHYLLDMTLDQANRPQYNLHTRPSVFQFSDEKYGPFMAGEAPTAWGINRGAIAVYRSYPGDESWLNSKNWGFRDAAVRIPIVLETIRTVAKLVN